MKVLEALGFICAMIFVALLFKCSDSSNLESNVKKSTAFYLHGREYECKNTERQLKVDKLNGEIAKLRE